MPAFARKCQEILMPTFFTPDPGKSHMQITTVEISINHGHDVCSPIAVSGFIHVIPYLFQLFKMILNTLVICACFRITRLVNIKIMCCRLGHYAYILRACDIPAGMLPTSDNSRQQRAILSAWFECCLPAKTWLVSY